jgi:hypothetical protein
MTGFEPASHTVAWCGTRQVLRGLRAYAPQCASLEYNQAELAFNSGIASRCYYASTVPPHPPIERTLKRGAVAAAPRRRIVRHARTTKTYRIKRPGNLLRGRESNPRLLGYEPNELPLLYLAVCRHAATCRLIQDFQP